MFDKVYSAKVNIIANFGSNVWIAFLNIVLIPFYLDYLGIEAYGIVGLFSSIQAFVNLLDFGLSPTLNRELARLSVKKGSAQEMHDLKRTLEIPNWISAILIIALISALAPFIANHWLDPKNLSVQTVTQALIIIGINIAIQFSMNLYRGGLMGLQKQLLLGVINVSCVSFRSIGALLVLILISPTIQAFLLWQGLISLIQLVIVAATLKRSLPETSGKGVFKKELLYRVWRFAAGITGLSLVGLILTQTDRIILSRMLNLESFGYYVLAGTVSGMALYMVATSISVAVYPQFSQLVSLNDERTLRELYHRSCQITSVFVFPIMTILTLFSYDILFVWTGKEEIASNTYNILSIVAVGSGLHVLMYLPHSLQLAYGWTRLSLTTNIMAVIFLVPLMIAGVYRYGAVGGAAAWVLLNVFYIIVIIQFMHRKILKQEKWQWYISDSAIPLLSALVTGVAGKLVLPSDMRTFEIIVSISVLSVIVFFVTALSTRTTREYLNMLKNKLLH